MRKADVIEYFESQQAVAEFLGISKQAVSDWDELVPRGIGFELQVRTDGRLKAKYPPRGTGIDPGRRPRHAAESRKSAV